MYLPEGNIEISMTSGWVVRLAAYLAEVLQIFSMSGEFFVFGSVSHKHFRAAGF